MGLRCTDHVLFALQLGDIVHITPCNGTNLWGFVFWSISDENFNEH